VLAWPLRVMGVSLLLPGLRHETGTRSVPVS
jgi:hypothetical protein